MTLLIADSGSTKTDWMVTDGYQSQQLQTIGINPALMNDTSIQQLIETDLIPFLRFKTIDGIYFYGAGCIPPHTTLLYHVLSRTFSSSIIEIATDMLGAARALWQSQPGIACILGTGSNTCLYDGEQITDNIPPLGYILGDEGSGTYLVKRFLSNCLKRKLSPELLEAFYQSTETTYAQLIQKIYREPMANRFLAGFAPFLYHHRNHPEIHQLLVNSFDEFLVRNILPYHSSLPLACVGSIAYFFEKELCEAARIHSIPINRILRHPIHDLTTYHIEKLKF